MIFKQIATLLIVAQLAACTVATETPTDSRLTKSEFESLNKREQWSYQLETCGAYSDMYFKTENELICLAD